MKDDLVDFEVELLRSIAGIRIGKSINWGSAVGAALETLKARGYVKKEFTAQGIAYIVTESGKARAARG